MTLEQVLKAVEAAYTASTRDQQLAIQDRLENLLYPETPKDLDGPKGVDAFPKDWTEEQKESAFELVMELAADQSPKDLAHDMVAEWTEQEWLDLMDEEVC